MLDISLDDRSYNLDGFARTCIIYIIYLAVVCPFLATLKPTAKTDTQSIDRKPRHGTLPFTQQTQRHIRSHSDHTLGVRPASLAMWLWISHHPRIFSVTAEQRH
ncbi:hypothetical protein BASA60_010838 [Batrachochytrium salamandrivorans]|nr:hypothetical protein BASA60_010838 [Batrachochytrium salamandrivorans]